MQCFSFFTQAERESGKDLLPRLMPRFLSVYLNGARVVDRESQFPVVTGNGCHSTVLQDVMQYKAPTQPRDL